MSVVSILNGQLMSMKLKNIGWFLFGCILIISGVLCMFAYNDLNHKTYSETEALSAFLEKGFTTFPIQNIFLSISAAMLITSGMIVLYFAIFKK